MSDEWYRRTTWSAADEQDFNDRLARSRRHNRSQYLRIQALHLAEARAPLHEASIALLDRLLAEYPDPTQLAQSHLQRAESLLALNRSGEAVDAFRAALDAERNFPNSRTNAYLRFAYFVAVSRRIDLFDEALESLEKFGVDEVFPQQHFLHNAALALIADESGAKEVARDAARRALQAAAMPHSGFRYHPQVGLVDHAEPEVVRRLTELSG